jgi:hypothetical protein
MLITFVTASLMSSIKRVMAPALIPRRIPPTTGSLWNHTGTPVRMKKGKQLKTCRTLCKCVKGNEHEDWYAVVKSLEGSLGPVQKKTCKLAQTSDFCPWPGAHGSIPGQAGTLHVILTRGENQSLSQTFRRQGLDQGITHLQVVRPVLVFLCSQWPLQ